MSGLIRTLGLIPRALEAILVLPRIAAHLDEVRRNTEALPAILARLEAVESSTSALADLEATLARVAAVADPLQGAALRLGRMADRLPQRRSPTPH